MKSTRHGAIALMLTAASFSPSAPAFDLGGVGVRGQAEAAWQYAPPRADTPFNPDGRILDFPAHTGILGLRLSPIYGSGPFTLRGDFWGQERIRSTDGDADFYTQAAALDWNVSDNVVLSGGVDIFKWGPGYIWNPSNPFQDQELNFEDRVFSYKRNGEVYASLDWTGEDGWGASAYTLNHKSREKVYGPDNRYEWAYALRLRKQFTSSDVALTYARIGDMNFVGGSYSAAIGDKLELHGEFSVRDRRRTALPRRIDLPGGTESFYVFDRDDRREWRPQFLLGGQYTTESLVNVIVEYLYNGEGYSEGEFDRLEDAAGSSTPLLDSPLGPAAGGFLGTANTLLGRMQRHYLFARISDSHLIGDLDARAFLRYGIEDQGVLLGGLLRYPILDRAAILMGGQYYGGASGSETQDIPFGFVVYSGFALYL
ncbi:hypothetical protein ACR2R6_02590 [Methylocaldum gracile subsp. desertum]|jgi:hypothetical protein|uniref:hypothetical protein n=1 Tax=Methylocaldum sp. GT1BW TaxID=3438964 RepID=UPI00105FCFCA